MFRPYELLLGLRYTLSGRRRFASFISLISVVGLALGVTALITVLSVMNGFERELRTRILGVIAHATLYDLGNGDWRQSAGKLLQHPEIVAVAPFVSGEGMLMYGGRVQGIAVRGILPEWEDRLSVISSRMQHGSPSDLRPGEFGILIGSSLARGMGVRAGDRMTLAVPEFTPSMIGVLPRLRQVRVVGIFEIGMHDYDSTLVLAHLEDVKKLYRREGVGGLNILTTDLMQAPQLSREAARELPGSYQVVDWTQRHRNFFSALKTERIAMFLILMLIVAVAAFNIVAMLMMTVTDKQANIAVLRTMGAHRRSILLIFVIHGTLIAAVGVLLGLLCGVWLALNVEELVPAIENYFQVKFLSPDIYYISSLPSDLRWRNVLHVGVLTFALGVAATLYPSWRAATSRPAEILRYE